MRKNYFIKLVRYMKNVYHLEHGLNKLSDGRVNPTYCTGQVILPVLFGFLLRIKSFNELNFMIKNNEFSKLFPRGTKLPKIDAIRDTLKVLDLEGLKQVNQNIVKTAVENKIFDNQLTTQREMVRLLLKGLYLLKFNAEIVFSSS